MRSAATEGTVTLFACIALMLVADILQVILCPVTSPSCDFPFCLQDAAASPLPMAHNIVNIGLLCLQDVGLQSG